MAIDTSRALYERTLRNLSELVSQRNEMLFELDEMASLPLSVGPASGHVAEFDVQTAMQLLKRIERQTIGIAVALEKTNQYARECGMPQVEWLPMPRPKADLLPADD